MTFRPKQKNKNAEKIALLCLLAAALSMVATAQVNAFTWLFQLIVLIAAVCAIQVFLKYILTDYVYELRDGNLIIHRIQGKKSTCLCSLSLKNSFMHALSKDEYILKKDSLPHHSIHFNYCKNIALKDEFRYFFDFNGKTALLVFEPDDFFAFEMNNIIASLITDKSEDKNFG